MKAARNGSLHKNVTFSDFESQMRCELTLVSKNQSSRLYPNDNPPHLIHEIKTIDYDVIDVDLFPRTLRIFSRKKEA